MGLWIGSGMLGPPPKDASLKSKIFQSISSFIAIIFLFIAFDYSKMSGESLMVFFFVWVATLFVFFHGLYLIITHKK